MLKRITILVLLALFTFTVAAQAQNKKKKEKKEKVKIEKVEKEEKEEKEIEKEDEEESRYYEDEDEFSWNDWSKHGRFGFRLHGTPFMELSYGLSRPEHKLFDTKFNDIGLAEIKLGYRDLTEGSRSFITRLNEHYLFASMIKKDLASVNNKLGNYNAEFLRFGIANTEAIGYNFGDEFAILPYHTSGLTWTSLRKIEYNGIRPLLITPDDEYINWVGDSFRFGTVREGGVKFELLNTFSINAGYEASVIFPRTLFWYWAGSALIEEAGMGILDNFIRKVFRSSPSVGPIVNFILKNAYSYAYHLLKKQDMNWPFDTGAPMTIESVKIGVTFGF